jgi:putative membrane protein
MNFIVKLLVSGLAVLLTAYLLPGVHIDGFLTALLVAVVLAILNTLVKPILVVLTIPLTILTLGLFLLVINAVIILLAGEIIGGFVLDGFWWALLFSIIVTVIMSIYESLAKD